MSSVSRLTPAIFNVTQASEEQRAYFPAIDALKTAAISAVVLTHSLIHPTLANYTAVDRWVGLATLFHVPIFLGVSGFLYYSTEPVSWLGITSRYKRVLVPYLVACLVTLLPFSPSAGVDTSFFWRVVLGDALGIYYYVFVLAMFIPLVWVFSRIPLWVVGLLLVLNLGYLTVYYFESSVAPRLGFFGLLRFPPLYFHYFTAGWILAAYARRDHEAVPWTWIGVAAVAAIVWYFSLWPLPLNVGAHIAARTLLTAAVAALVTALFHARPLHRLGTLISETTYTIFLYHLFAVHWLVQLAPNLSPYIRIPLGLVVGVGTGIVIALAGRRLLGKQRSQLLFGA